MPEPKGIFNEDITNFLEWYDRTAGKAKGLKLRAYFITVQQTKDLAEAIFWIRSTEPYKFWKNTYLAPRERTLNVPEDIPQESLPTREQEVTEEYLNKMWGMFQEEIAEGLRDPNEAILEYQRAQKYFSPPQSIEEVEDINSPYYDTFVQYKAANNNDSAKAFEAFQNEWAIPLPSTEKMYGKVQDWWGKGVKAGREAYEWQKQYEAQQYLEGQDTSRYKGLSGARAQQLEAEKVATLSGMFNRTQPSDIGQPPADLGGAFEEATKGLSPAQKQFFQGQDIYGEFDVKFPGARQAWWQAINTPSELERLQTERDTAQQEAEFWSKAAGSVRGQYPQLGGRTETYQQRQIGTRGGFQTGDVGGLAQRERYIPSGYYGYNPEESLAESVLFAEQNARARLGEVQGRSEEGLEAERTKAEDPWKSFVKSYPFMNKWYSMTPQQRGYYPSRYAPPAQWRI